MDNLLTVLAAFLVLILELFGSVLHEPSVPLAFDAMLCDARNRSTGKQTLECRDALGRTSKPLPVVM
jgi:hypothetical protein